MTKENAVPTSTTNPGQPQRKPRVALMGEFSSGKSTLSNMLLDGEPFPVKVTATRLPPIWTSYGEKSAIAVAHDGSERQIDFEDIASVSLDDTALIRLQRKTDLLELCDLIDMPGISDPNMPAHVWQSTLDKVDCVIWCTHATQAWRQSESAIWERAMPATNGRNILLVTQIDKLRNTRDRERVMNRVRSETNDLFEAVFPVSILQAMEADGEPSALEDSGILAFLDCLIGSLLKPLEPRATQGVTWDTVPELPSPEATSNRRITPDAVSSTGTEASKDARAEAPGPLNLEKYKTVAVTPKRVAKPKRNRTRPVRSETAATML